MSKICLKCGFQNPETPSGEFAECPKCGAIYSRVEKAMEKREAAAAEKLARPPASTTLSDTASSASLQKQVIVKTYKGSQAQATQLFQADVASMGAQGYVPTSQSWAPGAYGCGHFLLALLLCFVLIGFLIFIYMLLVKPDGVLSVTYEFRPDAAASKRSTASEVKTCPKCAEQVKAAAKICRFCGHNFEPEL